MSTSLTERTYFNHNNLNQYTTCFLSQTTYQVRRTSLKMSEKTYTIYTKEKKRKGGNVRNEGKKGKKRRGEEIKGRRKKRMREK